MFTLVWISFLYAIQIALGWTQRIQDNEVLNLVWWVSTGSPIILIAHLIYTQNIQQIIMKRVVFRLRSKQLVQQCAQLMIYAGLMFHWPAFNDQLPLIASQLVFAYFVDLWIIWRTKQNYRLTLSPTPIILSINLFIWFIDDYFYFQYVLVLIALLSRTWFMREWQGVRKHIFNPSAFAITCVGLVLICTESTSITWGETLAIQHGAGDYAHLTIFIAGLLALCLAPIGWITLSAVIGYMIYNHIFFLYTGGYRFIDTAIPPAVFLGMNLLVTDPVTSPRSRMGQISFGLSYALLSFLMYDVLRNMVYIDEHSQEAFNPLFLDKALCIPLLNYLVPSFDRLASVISYGHIKRAWWHPFIFAVSWCFIFYGMVLPQLIEHPGANPKFWYTACQESTAINPTKKSYVCEIYHRIREDSCEQKNAEMCYQIAQEYLAKDSLKAYPYLLKACHYQFLNACVQFAERLEQEAIYTQQNCQTNTSDPILSNPQTIDTHMTEVLTLSCLAPTTYTQQGIACFHLANHLASPSHCSSREANWGQAIEYLIRSCQLKTAQACWALGQRALMPPIQIVQQCQQGDVQSCVLQSHSMFHPQNILVSAREFLTVACDSNIIEACAPLSLLYFYGDGGEKDPTQVIKLSQKICTSGHEQLSPQACQWYQQLTAP